MSFSVRLVVIAVGSLAVFVGWSPRRMWSELPRVDDVKAALTAVVLLIVVVFWCFYAVRIVAGGSDGIHFEYIYTLFVNCKQL